MTVSEDTTASPTSTAAQSIRMIGTVRMAPQTHARSNDSSTGDKFPQKGGRVELVAGEALCQVIPGQGIT